MFPASPQVLFTLQVQGPHFKKPCSAEKFAVLAGWEEYLVEFFFKYRFLHHILSQLDKHFWDLPTGPELKVASVNFFRYSRDL